MGWFDNINPWKPEDPLSELDPELRKYLESQAPSSYKTAQESKSSAPEAQTYRERLGLRHNDPEAQHKKRNSAELASAATAAALGSSSSTTADGTSTSATEATAARPLPSESLYQDGRYAHLWSTYRPKAEIEDSGKSDQERLLDIVHGYKERQAQVGRAALENCSEQQWAVHECFRSGSWSALSTMCKAENRELSRCITMQSRFLRALGYLSMYERSAEESERIQMHADLLYQRMLAEEQAAKAAKTGGKDDESIAETIIAQAKTTPQMLPPDAPDVASALPPKPPPKIPFDSLPEQTRQQILASKKFKGVSGVELELAKREVEQNLEFHTDVIQRLDEHYRMDRKERLARLEAGEERVSDKIKRWFDFRKYGDENEKGQEGQEGEKK